MNACGLHCDLCRVQLTSNNSGQMTPDACFCYPCTIQVASKAHASKNKALTTDRQHNPAQSRYDPRSLKEGAD